LNIDKSTLNIKGNAPRCALRHVGKMWSFWYIIA
jgi:hypothetical protein